VNISVWVGREAGWPNDWVEVLKMPLNWYAAVLL